MKGAFRFLKGLALRRSIRQIRFDLRRGRRIVGIVEWVHPFGLGGEAPQHVRR